MANTLLSPKILAVCSVFCLLFVSSHCNQTIQSLCKSALYRQHCVSTFATLKSKTTADLAVYAVNKTLQQMQKLATEAEAVAAMKTTSAQQWQLSGCAELLELSWRHVSKALATLRQRRPAGRQVRDDVLTWLSAALTNHATCAEGLDVRAPHYQATVNVSRCLSSTLAVVRATSSSSAADNDDVASCPAVSVPEWMSTGDRRLVKVPIRAVPADAVVAQDGSGQYTTVTQALAAAPQNGNKRYVIYVKAGVYEEKIRVDKDNIMLVGDGKYATVITHSSSGPYLMKIPTFFVTGDGFIARDIGFENKAGARAGQAIALLVASDHSAFYRCTIKSNQDTLYAFSQRQFYRECDIYGTVDFIFGNAAAVFQNCNIFVRYYVYGAYVTAQGRLDPNQNTGFSIQFSKVTGAPGQPASAHSAYLGRPWRKYATVVFLQSFLDNIVPPAGWGRWAGGFALKTLYFGEYMNSGPGAGTAGRVQWPGIHIISSPALASRFTVAELIGGNSWIPGTGITFLAGLGG